MTTPFDPARQVWKIRVQFGDVISFIDDVNPDKRLVGTVYGVATSQSTAGTMATYRVGDEEDREFEIDNGHDPRIVDAVLRSEYDARRRAVVVRKNAEWAEKLKSYCCASRAVGYEVHCRCAEPRGYVPPRLTLRERCVALMAGDDSEWLRDVGKWQLAIEIAKLVSESAPRPQIAPTSADG